jgi:predicted glycosyltransferase
VGVAVEQEVFGQMKIMIDIGHPAHVHFYKNFIWEMARKGHKIVVTARNKDGSLYLLKANSIDHTVIGVMKKGQINLIKEWIGRDAGIYKIARKFKPDVMTGINNPCIAHVSRLVNSRSIIFNDTEHAKLGNLVTNPFAHVICTPACFLKDFGKKQIRYDGYHELAYLHPDYFKPNPETLEYLGLKTGDKYFILRFVSWGASHDKGQKGLSIESKRQLVKELVKYGRVLITSECPLPAEFEIYRIKAPLEKMHDLLHYATLYVGEGATMASEAAILGTPAVYINTLRLGYLQEQEEKYNLVYNYTTSDRIDLLAINKVKELLNTTDLKQKWQDKKDK